MELNKAIEITEGKIELFKHNISNGINNDNLKEWTEALETLVKNLAIHDVSKSLNSFSLSFEKWMKTKEIELTENGFTIDGVLLKENETALTIYNREKPII